LSRATTWDRIIAYWDLTKPRIAGMVLVAAMVGFYVSGAGGTGAGAWLKLAAALLGIGLVGCGANALNQYLESKYDACMARTRERPIPSGRLTSLAALIFGVSISLMGLLVLLLFVNPLATVLTGLTIASYLFVYTPLKRVTSLCVYVGAVPGALPPLIGWAAAAGTLSLEAWLLFAILYFWQLPHFAAIAWQYRDDYAVAGYPMLSVGDPNGFRTCRHMLTHSVALLMASLLPALLSMAGSTYALAALALGTAFLLSGAYFVHHRTTLRARGVVIASVLYLPLLFITLMADKTAVG
jgi:protoheme IX farnesyltransferase